MSSIQKQLSLLFDKRKQSLFVDYLTYQRIRSHVFSYPKKYQNGYTYYIDLANAAVNDYLISVKDKQSKNILEKKQELVFDSFVEMQRMKEQK